MTYKCCNEVAQTIMKEYTASLISLAMVLVENTGARMNKENKDGAMNVVVGARNLGGNNETFFTHTIDIINQLDNDRVELISSIPIRTSSDEEAKTIADEVTSQLKSFVSFKNN